MNTTYLFSSIMVMAGVTYLIRMVPLVFLRRRIDHPFVRSFLHYMPYAVLAAMTVPNILYSTSSILSAWIGLIIAVILAYFHKGLLTVAIGATLAVYVAEHFLPLM